MEKDDLSFLDQYLEKPYEAGQEVYQVSNEALELALQAARGEDNRARLEEKAHQLNSKLEQLLEVVKAAPANEQRGLNRAWADARLDLGYVLSKGELPTSVRLNQYLQESQEK